MSGDILKLARQDAKKIVASIGFEETIILTPPIGEPVLLTGFHALHYLGFDSDGNRISSKNAHITISEQDLVKLNYVYINSNTQEVDLRKHKISVTGISGVKNYVVKDTLPSRTLGLIVCVLNDAK